MQTVPSAAPDTPAITRIAHLSPGPAGSASAYAGYQIIRRNGAVVGFAPDKIAVALMKAFLAVHGTQGAASASVPCTARNAFISATAILSGAKPTTAPLRRMIW